MNHTVANRMKHLLAFLMPLALIVVSEGCGTGEATPTAQTVVFMGNSITYLWGQSAISPIFQQHPSWIDAGISGQTSGQMIARFQTDVVARHPSVVAILAGTNDVYPGWSLCGSGGATDTYHNIISMVLQATSNGIQPILETIPPWGCREAICALAEDADADPERYARIDALNQWITTYGTQQGLVVVNYWKILVADDGETYIPSMTMDGVHPSSQGYTMMSPLIEDALAPPPTKH
jgi:lysophospholipase L1-like esterase